MAHLLRTATPTLIVTLFHLTAAAHAQAPAGPEADTETIDTITVVGSTTNADILAEDLELWQANDLADVFRTVPSVSVGGSLGIAQKIYIRGVEDTLLNVTVDGAPQTGTLFHHIGRVAIEPELLKQVEVQAGAGEATSGFGAIGGALRFRTKDADDLLEPGQRAGALMKGGWFSNDGYKASLTGYAQLTDAWSALASYVYTDRENMEDGGGNELFGTGAEQSLGFLKLTGKFGNQRLTVSYERRDEEGAFGQRPNWPALEGDTLYPGKGERETFVANYGFDGGDRLNLEITAYSTQSDFEQDVFDRWGRYGATIDTYGFDVRNTTVLGDHQLVYGIEHRSDEVVSRYLDPSVLPVWAWDPAVGRFEEEGALLGIYLQDHYRLTESLLLSAGLRYDDYDLEQVTYGDGTSSDGVSANAGLRYDLTSSLSLTAGAAQAMRGKEVGDAFTLEKRPGRISLDPALDAEEVTNTEVGVVYDDGLWLASLSVFRMEIDDVILDQLGSGPPPQDASYYENVGTLESDGVEVRLGRSFDRLRAELFFTTYDSELNGNTVEGYEQIGLANASGDKWNLHLAYAPTEDIEIGWNSQLVEDLDDIVVLHRAVEIGWIDSLQTVDKPGYDVHDVYLQWRPRGSDALTLNLTVQNLFDEHYRDHASVADYNAIPDWGGVAGVYEAGRDVRLSLTSRL